MRTVPFREILHGVAYKLGLDPDQSNFLSNQAIPIGTYIDEWVRRTYDAKDWPEWVSTHQFAPNSSHVVPWDAVAIDLVIPPHLVGTIVPIGRVLEVYLVDPKTTDSPVDTPFTLRDDGIHVGYEHGTYVWIKFMLQPPKYTAVSWRPDTTFQKDDVTYSYTTGQVYKSKQNGNINHDPAGTFSPPPIPHIIDPPPPGPDPDVDTTQEWTHADSGLVVQNKIIVLSLASANPQIPPAVPLNFSTFELSATDNTGSTIAGIIASHIADGVETITDVLNALYTDLITGLPGGWTVTHDPTALTITIENASDFRLNGFVGAYARWSAPSGPTSLLKQVEIQPYIPATAASDGIPQITRVTMNAQSTVPGTTYTMTLTDITSEAHSVEYESQSFDTSSQILAGLVAAANASEDEFWEDVSFSFGASDVTLDIISNQTFSAGIQAPPPGSAWWELVPFPKAIADQVMTGALADLLDEWGQADKGMAKEGNVPNEAGITTAKFTTMPDPPLTGQQRGVSRYKMEP